MTTFQCETGPNMLIYINLLQILLKQGYRLP